MTQPSLQFPGRNYDDMIKWRQDIADHYGFKHSSWSVDGVDDFAHVPFERARYLRYHGGWGLPVRIRIARPATWLNLWRAADEAILRSGDRHHCYIEQFQPHPTHKLSLIMGVGS